MTMDKRETMDLTKQIQSKKNPNLRKTMTVPHMRRMLGLGKTESYWLVHRHFFVTVEVAGHLYVDVDSFEKWYANQVKHKKVDGEEPGKELRERTYSFQEAAAILGCYSQDLYRIWQDKGLEIEEVDFTKRIPKAVFEEWYAGQSKYKKLDQILDGSIVKEFYMPATKAAELLGISAEMISKLAKRQEYVEVLKAVVFEDRRWISKKGFRDFLRMQDVYQPVDQDTMERDKAIQTKDKPSKYITKQEAADIAGVSISKISRLIQNGKIPFKGKGYTRRIERSLFEKWIEIQEEKSDGND